MPDKHVYTHLCTWFKTRAHSGRWEMWNSEYAQNPHQPDVVWEDGRRDVASHHYPLMDVYDSSDPDWIDCQLMLIKLSGFDGVIVDWDGRRLNPYRHQGLMDLLPHLRRLGMKLILCFEEWCGYWPKGQFADREAELAAAAAELEWLMGQLAGESFYARVRGQSPVLVFRKIVDQWFSAGEWSRLASAVTKRQGALVFPTDVSDAFDAAGRGRFHWVGGFRAGTNDNTLEYGLEQYREFLLQQKARAAVTGGGGTQPLVFGSVLPGFDDAPVWGWGTGARIAPRYDTKRFEKMWELSLEHAVDAVQVVTWNDWNEGSQIEPAVEYGYRYLELNKRYAATFKGAKDDVPDNALRWPVEIYRQRKAGNRKGADRVMEWLVQGRYAEAGRDLAIS